MLAYSLNASAWRFLPSFFADYVLVPLVEESQAAPGVENFFKVLQEAAKGQKPKPKESKISLTAWFVAWDFFALVAKPRPFLAS